MSAPLITLIFILTVLLTVGFLLYALWTAHRKRTFIYLFAISIGAWMVFQGYLADAGFYATFDGKPRLLAAVAPPLLLIISLFLFRGSRALLSGVSLEVLTLLSIVRIPVEIVIDWWYHAGLAPQLMTFEGRNFDIISGVTAPIVFFFVFYNPQSSLEKGKRVMLIIWNVACLLLLINIVVNAVTSIPSPIQTQAFDQPNIAVLQYPFIWLPSVIVPAVLFSHLVSLWRLLTEREW